MALMLVKLQRFKCGDILIKFMFFFGKLGSPKSKIYHKVLYIWGLISKNFRDKSGPNLT